MHCNGIEGRWIGLRNFLRTFRGVSKKYLMQYVSMFQWSDNLKRVTLELLGIFVQAPSTDLES